MAFSRSRRGGGGGHDLFWPGYVDVLSTLLMVVTFLLSIFMVAQFYVSQESSGKDTVLRRLTRQIAELTNLLSLEKGQGKAMEDELSALQASLSTLKSDNERLTGLAGVGGEKDARISALCQGAGRQVVAVQRGTGQGRPPQPAAAAVAPADGGLAGGHRRRRKPRTRKARRASPTWAPASTSSWPSRCRSCSATAPISSAGCASFCATARIFASSATASCSSPRCCSHPARQP